MYQKTEQPPAQELLIQDAEHRSKTSPVVDAFSHHDELSKKGFISKHEAEKASGYIDRLLNNELTEDEIANMGNAGGLERAADLYLSLGPTSMLEGGRVRQILLKTISNVAELKNPKELIIRLNSRSFPLVSERRAALAGLIAYDLYELGVEGSETYKALAEHYCAQARQRYQEGRLTLVDEEKQRKEQGNFTDSVAYGCVSSAIINIRFDHIFDQDKSKEELDNELLNFVRQDVAGEKKEGFKYELLVFAMAQKLLIDRGLTDEYRLKLANLRQDASSKNSGSGNWKFNHDLVLERVDDKSAVKRIQIKSNGKQPNLSPEISLLSRDVGGNVEDIRSAFEKLLFSGEDSLSEEESDLIGHELEAIDKIIF